MLYICLYVNYSALCRNGGVHGSNKFTTLDQKFYALFTSPYTGVGSATTGADSLGCGDPEET